MVQEYHMSVKVWIQIRPEKKNVGPELGQNCLQRLSADDTDR